MAVSELPGNPNAVWTVKKNTEGALTYDLGDGEGEGGRQLINLNALQTSPITRIENMCLAVGTWLANCLSVQ